MRIGSVAGIPKNLKMYFSPGEFSQYFVVLQHTTSASSPSSSVNSKLASCKPASSSQSLVCPAPKWQLIDLTLGGRGTATLISGSPRGSYLVSFSLLQEGYYVFLLFDVNPNLIHQEQKLRVLAGVWRSRGYVINELQMTPA